MWGTYVFYFLELYAFPPNYLLGIQSKKLEYSLIAPSKR